jgi:hypothetical protein
MATRTFQQASSIGKIAVEHSTEYYKGLGYQVADVQEDKFFQQMDVDIILDGDIWVEIKGDTYRTGNLFIETIANINKGSIGCLLYTQADYIFYEFLTQGRALIIPVNSFHQWVNRDNLSRFDTASAFTLKQGGRGLGYGNVGYKVPEQVMLDEIAGVTLIAGLPVMQFKKGE